MKMYILLTWESHLWEEDNAPELNVGETCPMQDRESDL